MKKKKLVEPKVLSDSDRSQNKGFLGLSFLRGVYPFFLGGGNYIVELTTKFCDPA